ncbi:MAG: hypothetical protein K1000chlam4_00080 [Chlamydiae bacterium]|nr:hypothetical protein [Chlamydiota bacterium]
MTKSISDSLSVRDIYHFSQRREKTGVIGCALIAIAFLAALPFVPAGSALSYFFVGSSIAFGVVGIGFGATWWWHHRSQSREVDYLKRTHGKRSQECLNPGEAHIAPRPASTIYLAFNNAGRIERHYFPDMPSAKKVIQQKGLKAVDIHQYTEREIEEKGIRLKAEPWRSVAINTLQNQQYWCHNDDDSKVWAVFIQDQEGEIREEYYDSSLSLADRLFELNAQGEWKEISDGWSKRHYSAVTTFATLREKLSSVKGVLLDSLASKHYIISDLVNGYQLTMVKHEDGKVEMSCHDRNGPEALLKLAALQKGDYSDGSLLPREVARQLLDVMRRERGGNRAFMEIWNRPNQPGKFWVLQFKGCHFIFNQSVATFEVATNKELATEMVKALVEKGLKFVSSTVV